MITQAPLYFLVGSVVAFCAGLVCFSFSAFPKTIIPVFVTCCTAGTLASLVAVLFWLAGERWAFIRSKGTRWFITYVYPIDISWPIRWVPVTALIWKGRISTGVTRGLAAFSHRRHSPPASTVAEVSVDLEAFPRTNKESQRSREDDISSRPPVISPQPTKPEIPTISVRTASELESPYVAPRRKLPIMAATTAISRVLPSDPIYKHASPVLHVAFSPDGKSLASCGWDTHVLLWKAEGVAMGVYKTLVHPAGAVRQVVWSPDGRMILGRMRRTVVLWDILVRSLATVCF